VLNSGAEERASSRWKRFHSMGFNKGSEPKTPVFGFVFMEYGKA